MTKNINNKFEQNKGRLKKGDTIAKRLSLSDEDLIYLFEEKGLTAYKIAKRYGFTQQGIIARLRKLGRWKKKKAGNQFIK